MILIVLPVMLYFGGEEGGIEAFVGGGTWQSFTWALWEQLVGFALIIGLLGLCKKYFNTQGAVARQLSESAYGVFVIHAPVIVGISALFVPWQITPILKFMVLAPLALFVCFLLAWLIKQLPGVKKIL